VRSASTSLPGQPGSVPTARRWASSTLSSWGLPDTGWTAAQIVSELATNVTLHARSGFTVTLQADDDCVRLEVEDASPVSLQARAYGATATTGRGLHIVGTLAQDWGVVVHGRGKTVWVLLPVEDAQGDGQRRRRSSGARAGSGAASGKAAPSGTVALRWAA
jgi:anti-sigma regulatory factor (Ser/Thr protein kinase)